MWIKDIAVAMDHIFQIYGFYCCVECIKNNIITMSNGDRWIIMNNGDIRTVSISTD